MLKLLVFVSISAKLMAFARASEEVACTQQTTESYFNTFLASRLKNINPNIDDTTIDAVSRFYGANDCLMGICLYNQICTVGKKNIMSTVYQLLYQSSQLASFADESTLAQYLSIMNLHSMDEMDQVVPTEAKYFSTSEIPYNPYNYSSTIDYLIMADSEYQFTDAFKNKFSSTLDGKTINIDFQDSSATADYLNNWMRQDSCNQDYDFLSSEQSLDKSGLVVASCNHFTVYWDKYFKPSKTVSIDFNESDGNVVTTDASYFEGYARYNYDKNLRAEVVEFDMEEDFKMRIICPTDLNDLEETIFKLRTPSIYTNTFDQVQPKYLELTVPIQKDTCGVEDYVTGYKLANMMSDTFLPGTNVFSSGFENESSPYVAHMFHKMHLTIEDGQAAETVSKVSENSESSSQTVIVNKPFIAELICFDGTRVFSIITQTIK